METGYFSELRRRKLIVRNLGIFMRLCELSALGYAKPKASGLAEEAPSNSDIPSLESHQKFVVRRLALLNAVRDNDEMRFLDYWARWDKNILEAIDDGRLPFRYAKDAIASALSDIANEQKRNKRWA